MLVTPVSRLWRFVLAPVGNDSSRTWKAVDRQFAHGGVLSDRISAYDENWVNIAPDDPKWRWVVTGPVDSMRDLGNLPHS